MAQPMNGGWRQNRPRISASWCAIATLLGITQTARGVFIDALMFFIAALAFASDGMGRTRVATARVQRLSEERQVSAIHQIPAARQTPAAITIPVFFLAGVVLVFAPRHGLVVGVTMALIGLVALSAVWAPRDDDIEPQGRAANRAVAWWGFLFFTLFLWEFSTVMWGRGTEAAAQAHPPISVLLDPVLNSVPGRLVFVVAWAWFGTMLFRPRRQSIPQGIPESAGQPQETRARV